MTKRRKFSREFEMTRNPVLKPLRVIESEIPAPLPDHILDHLSADVSQAEIAALESEGQFQMVQP